MPQGSRKSGTYRRVKVKTPSNKVVIHYKRRKPKIAVCSICKKQLSGVRRELPYAMKGRKSSKRASRPYSSLCSSCSRRKIIEAARK